MSKQYNKIVYNGNTLIDLTNDTVTAPNLASGFTAHNAAGELITGTLDPGVTPTGSIDIIPSTAAQEVDVTNYATANVAAMPAGQLGTVSATKGEVSNHRINITPNISAGVAGYNVMGAKSGAAVSVSASELVSGTQTLTTNDTYDITNYASVIVDVPANTPQEVSTASEMDTLLVSANIGKIYKYTGTTTSKYVNGRLYYVTEE